jgi:hypothetical protein
MELIQMIKQARKEIIKELDTDSPNASMNNTSYKGVGKSRSMVDLSNIPGTRNIKHDTELVEKAKEREAKYFEKLIKNEEAKNNYIQS